MEIYRKLHFYKINENQLQLDPHFKERELIWLLAGSIVTGRLPTIPSLL